MRFLILFFLSASFSMCSHACSCAAYNVNEAYENYQVVFIGKVTDLRSQISNNKYLYPNRVIKVKFEVTKTYKGISGDNIEIVTNKDSATCGVSFEEGAEYVVFADFNQYENAYSVNLCSPTIATQKKDNRFYNNSAEVMKFLDSL